MIRKLRYWQKILDLTNWSLYIVREKDQRMMKKAWVGDKRLLIYGAKVFADAQFDKKKKVGFIRMWKLAEKVLVHELLHIKHPYLREDTIVTKTELYYNKYKRGR